MKKQIIRVSPIQTAKVAALMYFLLSIQMVVFMVMSFAFAFAFAPMPSPAQPSPAQDLDSGS